jgi:hypothetical protein
MQLELATAQQHAIANLLWSAENIEQVQEIIHTYGHVARVVYELMIAATFDEVQTTDLAEPILKQFARKL